MAVPHLLQFRLSHYAEKVRWALDLKGIAHTRETLVPGFHIPRVRLLTGQNQVPVLVEGGAPICGSAAILVHLEAMRPEPSLFPEDPALRARALALQTHFDTDVGPRVRRLSWAAYVDRPDDATRLATDGASAAAARAYRLAYPLLEPALRANMGLDPGRIAEARERLGSFVDRIEVELSEHGYLVGDRFSVADLAVAAVMSPVLLPPEHPYLPPEPWPPGLVELRASIEARPGSRWVREMYRRHRGSSAEITAR